MEFNEIASLISIRNFVVSAQDNYNLKKDQVTEMRSMLILLDRLIAEKILSDDFKQVVRFEEAKAATAEVRKMNDIKSGIKK